MQGSFSVEKNTRSVFKRRCPRHRCRSFLNTLIDTYGQGLSYPMKIRTLIFTFPFYLDAPSLDVNYPQDQSTTEGKTVTMTCVVEASNPEPNITWVKLSDHTKEFVSGTNLSLRNVTKADEGEYRCLAENGIGGQTMSRAAYLRVRGELSKKLLACCVLNTNCYTVQSRYLKPLRNQQSGSR